jgi:hypothetical protein
MSSKKLIWFFEAGKLVHLGMNPCSIGIAMSSRLILIRPKKCFFFFKKLRYFHVYCI